jgi:hypothetical protein
MEKSDEARIDQLFNLISTRQTGVNGTYSGPTHNDIMKIVIHSNIYTDHEKKTHRAASFLDCYMQNSCSIVPAGTNVIEFTNLHGLGKETLTWEEVSAIMCHVHVCIKKHFLEVQCAWKKLHDNPLQLEEKDKFLALVYLYKNFVEGCNVGAKDVGLDNSELLRKIRLDYQKAWISFEEENIRKVKSLSLHSESHRYQPFLHRLISAIKGKSRKVLS